MSRYFYADIVLMVVELLLIAAEQSMDSRSYTLTELEKTQIVLLLAK